MSRGGLDALFLLFFGICESHDAAMRKKLKMFVIFLPHDAAPHCEALPYKNSQQTFGEAPFRRPKTRLMKHHSLIVWAPGPFTATDKKITLY